jgi:outer membrane protein OmpA-like peptidoglycan-associated protein
MLLVSCGLKKKVVEQPEPVNTELQKIVTYDINFDVNQAEIKPESMKEVYRVKQLMDENPSLVYEVQGHTDSTGNPASNQRLSERRAQAIVDKMVELGIDPSRLTAVGKGQTEPIADNSTEEGRARNRRVEFILK